jgi:hypothetical protein
MANDRDEVKELFEAAHRDPQLKKRLLAEPEAVAKEFGAKLDDAEVVRLKQLGAFSDMVDELQHGTLYETCDPRVCYPVTVWQKQKFAELMRDYRYIPRELDPIYYPAPFEYDFPRGRVPSFEALNPVLYSRPLEYFSRLDPRVRMRRR